MVPEHIEPDIILQALEDGRRKALRMHKQAGLSVTIWENDRAVNVPPDEIEVERERLKL